MRAGDKVRLRPQAAGGRKDELSGLVGYDALGTVAFVARRDGTTLLKGDIEQGTALVHFQVDGEMRSFATDIERFIVVHSAAPGIEGAWRDVRAFHELMGVPIADRPGIPAPDRKAARSRFINEEIVDELLPAIAADDLPKIVDGAMDGIYVLLGLLVEYGVHPSLPWRYVQGANMAKIDPVTGEVLKDAGGKVLKPPGWTAPDEAIRAYLELAAADAPDASAA